MRDSSRASIPPNSAWRHAAANPGPFVGETERDRHRGRVRVGVDQRDPSSAASQLDGELDRDGRAPGRTGRPPYDDRAGPRHGVVRRAGDQDRALGEGIGDAPRLEIERARFFQPEQGCRVLRVGTAAEGQDADAGAVARDDEIGMQRVARDLEDQRVGCVHRIRDGVGPRSAGSRPPGGSRRHDREDLDAFLLES
ncbi:hypothetical protein QL996_10700 [Planococcus sp. APC 4015]|nr:hypothetical protein [Planococcus sp. APC 4015]